MLLLKVYHCSSDWRRPYVLSAAVAAFLALLQPYDAIAQCTPDPIGNGGTVTCAAGTDVDGFSTTSLGVTFQNTAGGTIDGIVSLGSGDDVFLQSGSSNSNQDIFMGGGSDAINLNGGNLFGSVFAGAGIDTVTLNGADSSQRIHGDEGNDIFNFLSGTAEGGTMGEGNDVFTLNGATINLGFDGNGGDDTLNLLSGLAFGFGLNNGDDTIVLDGATVAILGGESSGFYPGETGEDDIRLLSGQAGYVMGDEGDDTIVLDGATITRDIAGDTIDIGFFTPSSLGSGADVIRLLSGSVQRVYGGAGADVITLDGADIDSIEAGDGADEVYLLSGNLIDLDMGGDTGGSAGAGDDLIVLDGVVSATARFGGGDDADELRLLSGQVAAMGGQGGDDYILLDGAILIVVGGESAGLLPGQSGNDEMDLFSGTADFATGDAGDDVITLDGATITDTIAGDAIDVGFGPPAEAGSGDDDIFWLSGTVLNIVGGDGSDEVVISAATYDGTQVLDGGDDLLDGDGWSDELTLQGLSVTSISTNLINWETIVVDNSSLALSDAMLAVGSDAGTGLRFANGGRIDLQNAATGDAFDLAGNFLGGGQWRLDTALGDSASATDMLTISGDVSGASLLSIANVGGAGAVTSGNGILLVRVVGASAPNAFALLGGDLTVGDFLYQLVQVGNDWYLQSSAAPVQPSGAVEIPSLPATGLFLLSFLLGLLVIFRRPQVRVSRGI